MLGKRKVWGAKFAGPARSSPNRPGRGISPQLSHKIRLFNYRRRFTFAARSENRTARQHGDRSGGMAERFNAPVLKTDVLKGTGGSNPSSSAPCPIGLARPFGLFCLGQLCRRLVVVVGVSVCRCVGVSACRRVGMSVCRCVGVSVCRKLLASL